MLCKTALLSVAVSFFLRKTLASEISDISLDQEVHSGVHESVSLPTPDLSREMSSIAIESGSSFYLDSPENLSDLPNPNLSYSLIEGDSDHELDSDQLHYSSDEDELSEIHHDLDDRHSLPSNDASLYLDSYLSDSSAETSHELSSPFDTLNFDESLNLSSASLVDQNSMSADDVEHFEKMNNMLKRFK